jgi:hypothetical protein
MSSVDEDRVGRVARRAVRALRVVVMTADGAGAVRPIESQRCVGVVCGRIQPRSDPSPEGMGDVRGYCPSETGRAEHR